VRSLAAFSNPPVTVPGLLEAVSLLKVGFITAPPPVAVSPLKRLWRDTIARLFPG